MNLAADQKIAPGVGAQGAEETEILNDEHAATKARTGQDAIGRTIVYSRSGNVSRERVAMESDLEQVFTILLAKGFPADDVLEIQSQVVAGTTPVYLKELENARKRKSLRASLTAALEALKAPGADADTVAESLEIVTQIKLQTVAFHPVSAADLCASPPSTPPQLIHGMLYRGGTGIISAPSKGHKTYTLLDLSAAIAEGGEWLRFKTTVTPVLYVNLELSEHTIAKRLSAICSARGIKPPRGLHILNLRGRPISVETLHRTIVPMAKQQGAGLIVIDPYYKISSVSGVEENSNDGQAVFLAQVEAAGKDADCAIIMVHHFAKGDSGAKNSIDRASGGGVLARWPDVVATLTEHETKDCMTADFHLRDFEPIPRFVVRWTCPVWTVTDGEDPARVKRAGATDNHLASELLAKLPPEGLSNSAWCKASGWSDATFRRKRNQLDREGKAKLTAKIWSPR